MAVYLNCDHVCLFCASSLQCLVLFVVCNCGITGYTHLFIIYTSSIFIIGKMKLIRLRVLFSERHFLTQSSEI